MKNNFWWPEILGLIIVWFIIYWFIKLIWLWVSNLWENACARYWKTEFSISQWCKIYVEWKWYIPESVYLRQYEQNIKLK